MALVATFEATDTFCGQPNYSWRFGDVKNITEDVSIEELAEDAAVWYGLHDYTVDIYDSESCAVYGTKECVVVFVTIEIDLDAEDDYSIDPD